MHRRGFPRIAFAVATILATLVVASTFASVARAQTTTLTLEPLRNATYPVESVPGGSAKLVNGHFEVAAAPGSASKATADFVTAAIGTLGGQPRAAVVVASSGGGSSTLFDLHVIDASGATLAKVNLGDRIKVNGVSITSNGVVMVDMLTRRAGEPFAVVPTVHVNRAYGVNAAGAVTFLGPFDAPAPSTPAPGRTGNAGLVGTTAPGDARLEAMLLATVVGAAFAARRTGSRPAR